MTFESFKKRPSPYTWTTWITGLLSGSEQCHWKAWVKSHYQVPKPKSDFNLKRWIEEHDAMTARRVKELKTEGYEVSVEDANSFVLRGSVASLAGKPDIVAIKPDEKTGLIVDEKSGREKEQYIWQVLIYMFAKLFSSPDFVYSGEIEYKNDRVTVYPDQLNDENKKRISLMMKLMGGDKEPERVPSKFECGYCEIVGCPDRYQEDEFDVRAHF